MSENFKRKNFLASQTKDDPQYSVCVTTKAGRKLVLADPRITRVTLALMDMQAVLGGAASHWGGPSAFAELTSALYGLVFHQANKKSFPWYELFHLINDAGHCENGLYALKANYKIGGLTLSDLKGFRSINSPLTGHGEAHLFPEGVYLSNGPLGSTLAQAQGLCLADRLNKLKRSTVVLMSDGACMEGEAKEAFNSIPGFFQKNKMNPFIVIVSDNNTKLSGRIDEDSFSLNPFFQSLRTLGWEYREVESGHDVQSCVNTLEEVFDQSFDSLKKNPVFIRVKTIKGYGVKMTEQALHGGHGFPLKNTEKLSEFLEEIYGGKNIPSEFLKWAEDLKQQDRKKRKSKNITDKHLESTRVKVQEGIGKAMVNCRQKGLPVVSVSADLQGSTGVLPFRKKFPDWAFDVGVAEANMVSIAAGLSKQGFIPVVDTFTQFGVTKGALPLFMASLSQAPIIAVFSHAGFQDAADGASHQCLTYLAQTSALPMTDVYCLSSSQEALALMTQAIESFALSYKKGKTPRTQIFFLGRETFFPSYLSLNAPPYKLGKAQVVYSQLKNKGKAITLWAVGPLVEQALAAGKILFEKGWKVIVVNASIVNHPDKDTLIACVKETNFHLITLEDHRLMGGMGSLVAHQLALQKIPVNMQSLAINSDFGRSAYQSTELYKKERLMAEDIVKAVLSKT